MRTENFNAPPRIGLRFCLSVWALAAPWFSVCGAEQAADAAADPANSGAKKPGLFSSIGQSLKQSFDPKTVRGYFDQGGTRYYCMVDAKTGNHLSNAVQGVVSAGADGHPTFRQTGVSVISCDEVERSGRLVIVRADPSGGVTAAVGHEAPASSAAGASGPALEAEIAGVKFGMTPDQVRAVLAARKITETKEFKHKVAYPDPISHQFKPIDGSEYLSAIVGWIGSFGQSDAWQLINITFSPQAGRERVVEVSRVVNYAPSDAITLESLKSQLLDKYGRPWYDNPSGGLRWVYPHSGGGSSPSNTCHQISWGFTAVPPIPYGSNEHPQFTIAQPESSLFKSSPGLWQGEAQCERGQVSADFKTQNPNASPQVRVVTQFTVSAVDTNLAFEAVTEVARRMREAVNGANEGAVDQAKKQKAPDL